MTRIELIPSQHRVLNRHIVHDPRSWEHQVRRGVTAIPTTGVHHMRHAPVWDQGEVGCCTCDAMLGMLMTGPFMAERKKLNKPQFDFTQKDCLDLYRVETRLDNREIPGSWEPDDTGSSFLYAATAAKKMKLVNRYVWAFTVAQALTLLLERPLNMGTYWYEDMMEPNIKLGLRARGDMVGGHEYVIDEWDPKKQRVWMQNSWTDSWGIHGRMWMSLGTFGTLLKRDGDIGTVYL